MSSPEKQRESSSKFEVLNSNLPHLDLPDDVLVVGLGQTGLAAARFLSGMGKRVTIADEKNRTELAPALEALKGIDFEECLGPHRREDFLAHPMIVVSPGVDTELPLFKEARSKGITIVGELELASRFVKEPVIAITGTNGKTTVTTLIGDLFREAFGNVFVGGNIGNPLLNYVMSEQKASYLILEVSSFQLETIEAFRPQTAVLLNITEDHLDRYRSYEEYIDAKYRIFENQKEEDIVVLNRALEPARPIKARIFPFSSREAVDDGAFLEGKTMVVRIKGKEWRYPREISPLVGIHNTENLLVVLLVAHLYGVERDVAETVIRRFRGLPHRVEFVRELAGTRFYNDSKATNVDATKRALESLEENVILIAGGKDKGGSYKVVLDLMKKVKALILIGEAREKIREEIGGLTETYVEPDLEKAVARARSIARGGEVVLFSPMCSSFDMFKDYKERGNIFKDIVGAL
jgi:UDP-N-acetylmuramoylalanine--D-glutamate ligase